MAVLESRLIIGAKDETGSAFAAIKEHIAALDKQIGTFDKLPASAGKVMKSTDPVVRSIEESSKALAQQREAVQNLGLALGGMSDGAEKAAFSQGTLASAVEESTRLMVVQGSEAARVARQVSEAQQRQARSAREVQGGFKHALNETLPFAGPGILEATKKAVEEGGTVDSEIARLRAAGAKPEEIAKAGRTSGSFPRRTQACWRRNI